MSAFTIRSKHILSITFLFVVVLFCFIQGSKTSAFYALNDQLPTSTPTPWIIILDDELPTPTPVPTQEPEPLDYSLLDRSMPPSPTHKAASCGSRANPDLTDYVTVQAGDGYRWEYRLLPPTNNTTVVFQLHLEFLCTGDNGETVVLAAYDEPWSCSGTPTISNGRYRFNGSNGFDCKGRSLKVVAESLLTHLQINLPATTSVNGLYANATLGNVCNTKTDMLPLFWNEDITYRMRGNYQRLMAEFNHLSSATAFLSDPFTPTSPSRFSIASYQSGNTFIHALNDIPLPTNQFPTFSGRPFVLSTIQQTAKIGYGGRSGYCGDIFEMHVDPYSRIRSSGRYQDAQ